MIKGYVLQIRLLANVLEFACEPQRSVWTRELLSLLFPLAHRSRLARLHPRLLGSAVFKSAHHSARGIASLGSTHRLTPGAPRWLICWRAS